MIGFGPLVQLACFILRAVGIKTFGIDVDENVVNITNKNCVDKAQLSFESGIYEQILKKTFGLCVDGVIITAATFSLESINFAGKIIR